MHSRRTSSGVRQQTLLNLGADFAVPQDQWPALLAILEDLRLQRQPLYDPDPELHQLALQLHSRLAERTPAEPGDDRASVHPDTLDNSQVRSVGAERIALNALQELQFGDTLERQGVSPRRARLATALIVARMLHPSSERAACAWLNTSSATLELLAIETGKPLGLNQLYNIGDCLWSHREALESALSQRACSLFGHTATVVFVDLTNVHYCGKAGADRQYGRSKQRRSDCPLVSMGLTLDGRGFPLRSEILPGNVSEPSTLSAALEKLCAPAAAKPTVIMDAGLSTEANIAWLRAHGYHWITVARGKQAPPESAPEGTFETRKQQPAKVWKLDSAGAETRLCVWSEGRQAKEHSMLAQRRERFEQELRQLHAGLSKTGCTKRYARVLERLGRIQERHKAVASQYHITVTQKAPETAAADAAQARPRRPGRPRKAKPLLAAAVEWQRNAKHAQRSATAGTYLLRTSHCDWDLERVVRTYWQLSDIEATFRSLKGEVGLRPIYHSKRERIRAHLFVAVLAYHAIHLVRQRLAAAGNHASWTTLRHKLANWVRQTTTLQREDGRWIETRQDARPTPQLPCSLSSGLAGKSGDEEPWRRVFPAGSAGIRGLVGSGFTRRPPTRGRAARAARCGPRAGGCRAGRRAGA